MTKKELIEALKDFPDEAPIYIWVDGYWNPIIKVDPNLDKDGWIILNGESE